MKKIRIQIRHTGTEKLHRPHIQKLIYGTWGYNIYLGGRIFIAVRQPRKYGGSTGLIDIDFGKEMLQYEKAGGRSRYYKDGVLHIDYRKPTYSTPEENDS